MRFQCAATDPVRRQLKHTKPPKFGLPELPEQYDASINLEPYYKKLGPSAWPDVWIRKTVEGFVTAKGKNASANLLRYYIVIMKPASAIPGRQELEPYVTPVTSIGPTGTEPEGGAKRAHDGEPGEGEAKQARMEQPDQ